MGLKVSVHHRKNIFRFVCACMRTTKVYLKGTKIPYVHSSATAGLHMGHVGAPKDIGRKHGRKNDQYLQKFFQTKTTLKSAQKSGFVKNGPKLVILTCSLEDLKNILPLKVCTTVVELKSSYF